MANEKMTLIERLENPSYGQESRMASDMKEASAKIAALQSSLEEMLGVYWGKGDGQEPPPACIQRAQQAIEF